MHVVFVLIKRTAIVSTLPSRPVPTRLFAGTKKDFPQDFIYPLRIVFEKVLCFLHYIYLLGFTFDIKTTVSTVVSVSKGSSFTSSPSTGTGKLNTIFFIQLPSFLFSGNISIRSIKAFINSFCSASVAEW